MATKRKIGSTPRSNANQAAKILRQSTLKFVQKKTLDHTQAVQKNKDKSESGFVRDVRHALEESYQATIVNHSLLRRYEGFSPQVYGETNFKLVQDFIKNVPIREGSNFVDLGSGVGQVVLQVAASGRTSSAFGVEFQAACASYGNQFKLDFPERLRAIGHSIEGSIELVAGDFFASEETAKHVADADVVFVNNTAFGATVDNKLVRDIFCTMKDKSKIVSFVKFCTSTRGSAGQLTLRNMTDPSGILKLEKVCHIEGKSKEGTGESAVSWTGRDWTYYVYSVEKAEHAERVRRLMAAV